MMLLGIDPMHKRCPPRQLRRLRVVADRHQRQARRVPRRIPPRTRCVVRVPRGTRPQLGEKLRHRTVLIAEGA